MDNSVQLTGQFTYDMKTRALFFDFDEASQKYMAGQQINHLMVQVHDIHQQGIWMDAEKNRLHKSIVAARLTFSNKKPNQGALIGLTETVPIAPQGWTDFREIE